MERRLVKVLKAVAELRDLSLGELLAVIVHDVFAGRVPFDGACLAQVSELLAIYGAAPAAPSHPCGALGDSTWEVVLRLW